VEARETLVDELVMLFLTLRLGLLLPTCCFTYRLLANTAFFITITIAVVAALWTMVLLTIAVVAALWTMVLLVILDVKVGFGFVVI
jgi:hypothetical protein